MVKTICVQVVLTRKHQAHTRTLSTIASLVELVKSALTQQKLLLALMDTTVKP